MSSPKVSIVIPVYNGANYLKEAIESALAQTYQNIEIIVVNDGSSDNWLTENIALSFGDRIRYFKKVNWGVSTALNFGIEKMTGDHFSWLSHDDLYHPAKIQEQVTLLSSLDEKSTIISSNYQLIDERWLLIWEVDAWYESKTLLYKLLTKSFLNGCTLLIPKEAFLKVGYFDVSLKHTQDYHLWFRMMKEFIFINLNKPLVKSRQHWWQESKMNSNTLKIEKKQLNSFVLRLFTINEIRTSYGWLMPLKIFSIYLRIKLGQERAILFLIRYARYFWVYDSLSSSWREYIAKKK
jgi:glycosyltransferase involved in cell wall biosynthesis